MINLEAAKLALFGATSLSSQFSKEEKEVLWGMYNELLSWRENVRYMLDNEPLAVRVHEGGAVEEDLIASLCVTFMKLQKK